MRKMNRILKVKSILFPSLGLICILFSDRVTLLLPYLLGSAMVLVGTLMVVSYFKDKKFFEKQADEFRLVLCCKRISRISERRNANVREIVCIFKSH